jgi:hypothetical protein
MLYSHYLIKNCSAKDFESVCPKHWGKLKPAFSDMVRHCDHCNKKVYLCETDEQIKFYSLVKFCIAVAEQEGRPNVERNPPSNIAAVSNAVDLDRPMASVNRLVPNVWRRASSHGLHNEVQQDYFAALPRMQQVTDDSDIPVFLRKRSE